MSKEKVVLAYSGGLDTSVCVKWLQDEKNLDVVCVCGNVGQEETGLDAKKQKALDLGVLDCQVLDLRDEFSDEFLTKAIAANSMYENKYPLLRPVPPAARQEARRGCSRVWRDLRRPRLHRQR